MNFALVVALLSFALAIPNHYGCPAACDCYSSFSSCPSSSSSSSSSWECSTTDYVCCDELLVDYDFKLRRPEIGVDWQYLSSGNFTADNDDPNALTYGCSSAKLNTNPFRIWSPPSAEPWLDHYKWFIQTVEPISVRCNDTITAEFKTSVQVCKIDQAPFPCQYIQEDDYRLGAGVFSVWDPLSALNFGFIVTNDRIYGLYSRYFGATNAEPGIPYAVFAYVLPFKHRKSCDINRLKLIFTEGERTVSYSVDGQAKFVITKPGYRLSDNRFRVKEYIGLDSDVYPSELILGFGTMTFLDYYPACKDANCIGCGFPANRTALVNDADLDAPSACNPIQGCPYKPVYWDPIGTSKINHIWGQGVTMELGGLRVNRHACYAS